MPETNDKFPRARVEKLIKRNVQDELIVYDLVRDVGTCLNSFAAEVWDRCDGQSSPATIAQVLSQSLQEPVHERTVWFAILKLSRANLLAERIKVPPSESRASRREVLHGLSLSAASAVPLVLSIKAPAAAQAATCTTQNHTCGPGFPPCCPGLVCTGGGIPECQL
jgi:hypothetical protein